MLIEEPELPLRRRVRVPLGHFTKLWQSIDQELKRVSARRVILQKSPGDDGVPDISQPDALLSAEVCIACQDDENVREDIVCEWIIQRHDVVEIVDRQGHEPSLAGVAGRGNEVVSDWPSLSGRWVYRDRVGQRARFSGARYEGDEHEECRHADEPEEG